MINIGTVVKIIAITTILIFIIYSFLPTIQEDCIPVKINNNRLNEWEDPITSNLWFLGGANNWSNASLSCTAPYDLPTRAEGMAAVNHGIRTLAASLGITQTFWSKDIPGSGDRFILTLQGGAAFSAEVLATSIHSIFCIKR